MLPGATASALIGGSIVECKHAFSPLQVGLALLSRLPAGKNAVISPQSIASVLAMLYCGAKGHTRRELETALCMSTEATERFANDNIKLQSCCRNVGTQVRSSNGIYVRNGLTVESDYVEYIKRLAAKFSLMDFAEQPEAAREQINAWIAEETGGLIKDLMPCGVLNSETAIVLANAVYFKGLWMEPFKAKRTRDGEFTTSSGNTVIAKMMTRSSSFPYAVDNRRRLQMLFLPYSGDGDLGMLILLPTKGTSLDACLAQKSVFAGLTVTIEEMELRLVDVMLPRFSASSVVDVSEGLGSLGVESLFSGHADLSGVCRERMLSVSSCMHKAVIDVTEEGTEAAAATYLVECDDCSTVRPEKFACNRPFAFVIWHKPTAAALFLGRVEDPSLQAEK